MRVNTQRNLPNEGEAMRRNFAKNTLFAVLAISVLIGLDTTVALASTNPGPVNSSYYFDTNLYGATQFTVYGTSGVQLQLAPNYGPTESVDMVVEVQTCGFFGCNWNGQTIGGTCTRTLYNGGYATCNWSVPASNVLHRIDFTKAYDGHYIGGLATIQ